MQTGMSLETLEIVSSLSNFFYQELFQQTILFYPTASFSHIQSELWYEPSFNFSMDSLVSPANDEAMPWDFNTS